MIWDPWVGRTLDERLDMLFTTRAGVEFVEAVCRCGAMTHSRRYGRPDVQQERSLTEGHSYKVSFATHG